MGTLLLVNDCHMPLRDPHYLVIKRLLWKRMTYLRLSMILRIILNLSGARILSGVTIPGGKSREKLCSFVLKMDELSVLDSV